jgi:hypothetical protein
VPPGTLLRRLRIWRSRAQGQGDHLCQKQGPTRLTGQTAPGRRFPGHWPTPWRGSAGRGRVRESGPRGGEDFPYEALCSSAAALEHRSGHAGEERFVVGDAWGFASLERARRKLTTRARLPKRVRPTSQVLGQKRGGVQGNSHLEESGEVR